MAHETSHPSDEHLLLAVDGELSTRRMALLEEHLLTCAPCRERRRILESSLADLLNAAHDSSNDEASSSDLRARLGASMAEASRTLDSWWGARAAERLAGLPTIALAGAAVLLLIVGVSLWWTPPDAPVEAALRASAIERDSLPIRALTPGATEHMTADELCAGGRSGAYPIPASVRQTVLRDYGMEHVPDGEYELDYLITPELGGAPDRRNLWPERYTTRVWNAGVKDELEQLLERKVCDGTVDLATAQQDIAADWIAAYRKYFNTTLPLRRDARARPWSASRRRGDSGNRSEVRFRRGVEPGALFVSFVPSSRVGR